jgi:predicted HAD superfamily phosphohydrolase
LALSNNLANRATNCEIRRIGGLLIASAGHTKMVVQTMLELDSVAVISETIVDGHELVEPLGDSQKDGIVERLDEFFLRLTRRTTD